MSSELDISAITVSELGDIDLELLEKVSENDQASDLKETSLGDVDVCTQELLDLIDSDIERDIINNDVNKLVSKDSSVSTQATTPKAIINL